MIKGTKDYLDQLVKTHKCPEHGPKLSVAWHGGEDSYVIRCAEGHFPEEITRELTPIEQHKAGEREAHTPITSLLPKTDLATGEILTDEVVKALVLYADKYHLDSFRGHVVLMYGKPYITLDGYLYHARKLKVPYRLSSKPLNEDQRKLYNVGPDDHAWLAEVDILEPSGYFVGIGIVTRDEMEAKSPRDKTKLRSPVVAAHPWQLAQKRAEWQALRRAFPIGETEEEPSEA